MEDILQKEIKQKQETIELGVHEDILLYLKNKYQAQKYKVNFIKIINLWKNFYRINFYDKKLINLTDEKTTEGIIVQSYFIRVDEKLDGYYIFNYDLNEYES